MNNLIRNEGGKLRVSGRLLHKECRVEQDFTHWIKQQIINTDADRENYNIIWINTNNINDVFKDVVEHTDDINTNSMVKKGYQMDYILDIELAKEICMVMGVAPRTNPETKKLSKQTRKYFIECEKKLKEQQVPQLTKEEQLQLTILNGSKEDSLLALKEYKHVITAPLIDTINALTPIADYANNVLNPSNVVKLLTVTEIAKDLGTNAKALNKKLHKLGVQYSRKGVWYFYSQYEYLVPEYADYVINEHKQYLKWTEKGR